MQNRIIFLSFLLCASLGRACELSQVESKKAADTTLSTELNEQAKAQLLIAHNLLFRAKSKNPQDNTDVGPGLPGEIGAIIIDDFIEEWNTDAQFVGSKNRFVLTAKFLPHASGVVRTHLDELHFIDGQNITRAKLPVGYVTNFELSSANDKPFLAAIDTSPIEIWDLNTDALACTIPGHEVTTSIVKFTHDGAKVISAGNMDAGKKLQIWDLNANRGIAVHRENGAIMATSTLYDDSSVAMGIQEQPFAPHKFTIKIYDSRTGQIAQQIITRELVKDLCVMPGDQQLIASETDGLIHTWDRRNNKPVCTFDCTGTEYIAINNNGTKLVSCGYKKKDDTTNSVYLWDVTTGGLIKKFSTGDNYAFASCDISADGKCVLAAANDKVYMWHPYDMKKIISDTEARRIVQERRSASPSSAGDKADGKTNT